MININSRNLSPLDRLAYIGCRRMGPIKFIPLTAEKFYTGNIIPSEGIRYGSPVKNTKNFILTCNISPIRGFKK